MAFSRIQSTCVPIPSDWEEPRFVFGERVIVLEGSCWGRRKGIVTALEYVFKVEQCGGVTDVQRGWHYSILIDEDEQAYKSDPYMIVHESYLMESPDSLEAVTSVGMLN